MLDLSYNELKVLDFQEFRHLFKLNKLKLFENHINSIIPANVENRSLQYASHMYLPGNKVGIIPKDAFNSIRNCTSLILNYNNITTIEPNVFRGLVYLKHLEMKSNKLHSITNETFRGLYSLTFLELSENKISLLENGFL